MRKIIQFRPDFPLNCFTFPCIMKYENFVLISSTTRHDISYQRTSKEGDSMTREDYIKSLIKSHGYTLKAFAQQISMPYTTLLSILNGSIGGAAMDNVLKICHALNVRIEELDQISNTGHLDRHLADGSDEAQDESLMELIRDLPPEKKIALKILLTNL